MEKASVRFSLNHRAIGHEMWRCGRNTREIARELGLAESEVVNGWLHRSVTVAATPEARHG